MQRKYPELQQTSRCYSGSTVRRHHTNDIYSRSHRCCGFYGLGVGGSKPF